MFWALLIPCLFTVAVETLVLLYIKDGKKWLKPQLICNVITNPLLHLLLPLAYLLGTAILGGYNTAWNTAMLIIFEVGIVFAEASLVRFWIDEPYKKRLLVSAILNTASFLLGLLCGDLLDALIKILIK